MIDKESGIPLYLQLANLMKQEIQEMESDEKYYSEIELVEKYNVSRPTIRHSIEVLEKQNYIYKVRGKGTFVYPRKVTPEVNEFISFSDMIKKSDKLQKTTILSFEVEEADVSIISKLNLITQKKVYKIVRLREFEDVPVIIQTIYLPFQKFPNLTKEMLDANGLYGTMKEIYNMRPTTIDDVFQVTKLNREEASVLKQSDDEAAMLIKRVTKSNEVPVEYTASIVSGYDFNYKVQINVPDK